MKQYVVDAFTDKVFHGNQAAICVMEQWLSDDLMMSITQENNKLCIIGKKKYTAADVFPNENLQLLGEVMFTPGRATLGLSISDILGNIKQLSYNILIK